MVSLLYEKGFYGEAFYNKIIIAECLRDFSTVNSVKPVKLS